MTTQRPSITAHSPSTFFFLISAHSLFTLSLSTRLISNLKRWWWTVIERKRRVRNSQFLVCRNKLWSWGVIWDERKSPLPKQAVELGSFILQKRVAARRWKNSERVCLGWWWRKNVEVYFSWGRTDLFHCFVLNFPLFAIFGLRVLSSSHLKPTHYFSLFSLQKWAPSNRGLWRLRVEQFKEKRTHLAMDQALRLIWEFRNSRFFQ